MPNGALHVKLDSSKEADISERGSKERKGGWKEKKKIKKKKKKKADALRK